MIFTTEDVRALYKNKKVVFIGDSVVRCMYKDLVWALQRDDLVDERSMKLRAEDTYINDSLIYRTKMSKGYDFQEIREYQAPDGFHLVQYYFVTRCYNRFVEAIINDFQREMPDLIIMNSTQWDVSRYGHGVEYFIKNMNTLLTRLQAVLKPTATFLWITALPLSSQMVGGYFLEEMTCLSTTMRIFILDGNYKAAQLVTGYGFNVLDLHYYFRPLVHHRLPDGVHWDSWSHRHMTELIMVYVYDTWNLPLPLEARNKLKYAYNKDGPDAGKFLGHLQIPCKPTYIAKRKLDLEERARNKRRRLNIQTANSITGRNNGFGQNNFHSQNDLQYNYVNRFNYPNNR